MLDPEMWQELLEAWLKSIGCENVNVTEWHFIYKGRQYKYDVLIDLIDVGLVPGPWANIDLDVWDVDPCNPSFDPDELFVPLKEWMDTTSTFFDGG